jgi:PAS domain S-box-containing protein
MSAARSLTIGFTRHIQTGNAFWAIVEHSARKRAHELGATIVARYCTTSSEQIATIRAFVQQRVDAIIVGTLYPTDSSLFAAAIEQATAAGIPAVAVDAPPVTPMACLVRSNDAEAMATVAEYLAKRLGGQGQVVHLQGGMLGPLAYERSLSVHEVFGRFPGLEIVVETDRGQWERELARDVMREALAAHPDIRGVIAANDLMALGALDILADAGRLGKVVVTGVDGDPRALRALETGTLAATVGRSPSEMGRTVVEMAVATLKGSPVPSEINLRDMTLVTGATVAQAALDMLDLLPETIAGLIDSRAALDAERTMLRTIIDTLPDGIYVKDRDSRFEVANQAVAQSFGLSDPDALIGKTDFDFHPPELAAQYYADEQAIIQSGMPLLNKEEIVVGPDGTRRWALSTKVPLRDHQGRIVKLVGRGQDITERKQAEQERRAFEHKLLETQKLESLGVLAGGIAHDFNNLLVAILGNADLALLDLPPEAPARAAITQIETAARRAADLTHQMLAYAGKGRFVVQRLNINAIVEEMTHLLQASIPKNVALRYYLPADLPAVEADATQLRQIVMNLVVNAAEAIGTKAGIISITTGVQRADQAYLAEVFMAPNLPEGQYVLIEVADTGAGMDEATRAKIFDPFFTTKFTGRGLGLAAVLGIVRGHGGALKVYSEPGRGSTFKILLPGAARAAESIPTVRKSGASWQGSGTVLVIDDEPHVRTIAKRMLEHCGFTVLTAEEGQHGVKIFGDHAADIVCVLLDMTMPKMDGPETFRQIRRINPQARVLLMSGYNEQEAISRFAGKGIAGFLPKPFTLGDLTAKLRLLFEAPEQGTSR